MLIGFFFAVCFIASSVGAVVGAGGGVIIKPVLDMVGILPVSTVSFCSGCTVLAMSVCSLIRTRNNGVQLKIKTSTALAVGAVVGGLLGQILFDLVRKGFGNESVLGAIQAICLTIMTVGVLLYVIFKSHVKALQVDHVLPAVLIGLILGLVSAFLGIGGGPMNVAVLYYFFSMDAKQAAKNSIYIIIFSQTTSLISSLIRGTVPDFTAVYLIAMICGGVGGALLGAAITRRLNNSGVEKVFNILLLIIIAIGCYNIFKYTHM